LKSDLKSELNEKIAILKELENLKANQKMVQDKQISLKAIIDNTNNETEKVNLKIKHITREKEELEERNRDLNAELNNQREQNEEMKEKFKNIYYDLEVLNKEYEQVKQELEEKKFSDQEVFKLSDKYEEEIFALKIEMNIWKFSFIEIARYKLISYNETNLEELISLDRNYLSNAPKSTKERIESIVSYFKSLIDEENYKTINIKSIKEAHIQEQEKNLLLREQLMNELVLRRKIHNRYMSLRGNLRVMCRIRPFIDNETGITKKAYLDHFKVMNDQVTITENTNSNNLKMKKYDLDYIFQQNSTQQDVYDEVSLLVQNMLNGTNVCIIAYGQTTTGKSYTIQGPNKEFPGIALRSAKELFEMIGPLLENKKGKSKVQTKLSISIIEIYNDVIYNLLGEGQPALNMYENNNGNLAIPDLNPISINNYTEANKLFKLSAKLRQTNQTNYNDRSSRSHCIYSFYLKIVEEDGSIIRSKLHIIDLAGSERLTKSHDTNPLLRKEAISINLSLNALSNVLNAIAVKQNHIPYRDSKLTHFLKESLNDNFNILLLLHVSPNIRDLSETNSTLEFGTRIAKLCKHKTGKEKIQSKSDKYM